MSATFVLANVLQPLISAAEAILKFFHGWGVGWGVSIILLTVAVRAALLPLTLRQAKSMRRLQLLSPQIKELQAKYKEDKQRLNEEMMRFYKENKVNPLSSCLPLVLQVPFFIALFYMLRHDLRFDICPEVQAAKGFVQAAGKSTPCGSGGDASFLFIPDLTNRATGAVLIALLVLYVGSQLASSLLMTVSADKNQRRLMLMLPLFFVAFILNFPAGLIVYWITTNLWTIVQQLIVRRTVGPPIPAPAMAGGGGGLLDLLKGTGGTPQAGARTPTPAAKESNGGGPKRARARDGGSDGAPPGARRANPPPAPRKRKKRSGRRR